MLWQVNGHLLSRHLIDGLNIRLIPRTAEDQDLDPTASDYQADKLGESFHWPPLTRVVRTQVNGHHCFVRKPAMDKKVFGPLLLMGARKQSRFRC